ncbi:MAG: type I 3-dehydroquinate dehydratase [Phycisphaerae bacterium]
MTLLFASIAPTDVGVLDALAQEAWRGGADAVELRIDTFAGEPSAIASYLREHGDRTWIITCRSREEGGESSGDAHKRASLLVEAARGTNAYLDFEFADWCRSEAMRIKPAPAGEATGTWQHKLILSVHDFSGVPPQLASIAEELLAQHGAVTGKVAYQPSNINDTFAALDLVHKHGRRITAVCMGADGLWTRVLARKLGAFASYCSLSPGSETAPGQATLAEMVNRYRWPCIDSSTQVFGVLGDPVAHSMSPLLFNHWFDEAKLNAVYLPLLVRRTDHCLQRFLDECLHRSWLGIGGFSVTTPHKAAALEYVGAGTDRLAASIGALNTILFRGGRVLGFNTDCHAAVDSIVHALGCERVDLCGLPVDVLGSGGAARAVVAGLRDFGCDVTIYARSLERGRIIAQRFNARSATWEDRKARTGKVLINCTSMGMWPETTANPMSGCSLRGCRLVFDLIYNPSTTTLLAQAAAEGVATLGGLDMFIRQAAAQFELWVGRRPDTRAVRDLLAGETESHVSRPR